jgi:uncharacterized protein YndB with AHSA1/START domain
MATRTVGLDAPPERVFAVLENPASLGAAVPGTRRIRHFDPAWPALGTRLHHSVGLGPFVLRDHTEVLEVEPPHRLVLEARLRPLGSLRVEFSLAGRPGGTELTIDEQPAGGLVALAALRPLVNALLRLRNHELGRRLRRIVAAREARRRSAA